MATERRVFFLLVQAQRALVRRIDEILVAEHGVTSAQAGALMYLARHDATTLTRLGEGLALNPPAITGLTNRLQKLGLVERRDDPDDGRAYRLTLTDEGRRRATALRPRVRSLHGELVVGFSAQEMSTVTRFLRRVLTRFQESS